MIILGVDPGLASLGWGVVEKEGNRVRYRSHGTITTVARDEPSRRLQQIYLELQEIIERSKAESMAVETLFFARNISSALPVAQARGVILLTAALNGIPCMEFAPNEIKQSVVGVGKANKDQVTEMVKMLLGKIPEPLSDHSMDALAIAICCAHQGVGL